MRWRYENGIFDLGRGIRIGSSGSCRMMSRVRNSIFFFKGLSPNRHRPLLDRVNSSGFELSQLCRFAKCLVLEEQ